MCGVGQGSAAAAGTPAGFINQPQTSVGTHRCGCVFMVKGGEGGGARVTGGVDIQTANCWALIIRNRLYTTPGIYLYVICVVI